MREKSVDSQLWHACAGSMVQIPRENSKVFYFPQGHAEHSLSAVNFAVKIPPLVFCRVSAVKFLADSETDEVYAKFTLVPLQSNELSVEDDSILGSSGSEKAEKPVSFAKTLTQSDANNGGGFSVPRYCAETISPKLDFTADPPGSLGSDLEIERRWKKQKQIRDDDHRKPPEDSMPEEESPRRCFGEEASPGRQLRLPEDAR